MAWRPFEHTACTGTSLETLARLARLAVLYAYRCSAV